MLHPRTSAAADGQEWRDFPQQDLPFADMRADGRSQVTKLAHILAVLERIAVAEGRSALSRRGSGLVRWGSRKPEFSVSQTPSIPKMRIQFGFSGHRRLNLFDNRAAVGACEALASPPEIRSCGRRSRTILRLRCGRVFILAAGTGGLIHNMDT